MSIVRKASGAPEFVGSLGGLRRLASHAVAAVRGRAMSALVGGRVAEDYHRWYYESGVQFRVTWEGVPALKSVQDLWTYQEIIWDLRPSVVLEFGSHRGGSALWFARVLDALGSGRVVAVEADSSRIDARARAHPRIEIEGSRSTDPELLLRLAARRAADDAPWFVILDSDHAYANVLAELESVTPFLRAGDHVIVEDSNINGHPVLPGWGPGPFEAIDEFERRQPGAYRHDTERERKFGWTFAPNGFLVRT